MLSKELLILDQINTNADASQRDLAMSAGISLGQINQIIKRLCADGLLHQDEVGKHRLRYTLTQRGLAERARLSNENILSTIGNYRRIKSSVAGLLDRLYSRGYREFVLEGERGEIHNVISEVFKDQFNDKASLVWGPVEPRDDVVILNLDRRFMGGRDVANVLHEIRI